MAAVVLVRLGRRRWGGRSGLSESRLSTHKTPNSGGRGKCLCGKLRILTAEATSRTTRVGTKKTLRT